MIYEKVILAIVFLFSVLRAKCFHKSVAPLRGQELQEAFVYDKQDNVSR